LPRRGLRLVHLLDDAEIELVGVRQMLDLTQRLILAGRLEHERAIAEHAPERGLLVLHVGDPQQGHHRDLAGDDAVDDHHALVGQDEPVEIPVEDLPGHPADHGKPDEHRDGDKTIDVLPGQEAGEVTERKCGAGTDREWSREVDPVAFPLAAVPLGREQIACDQCGRLVLQRQHPPWSAAATLGAETLQLFLSELRRRLVFTGIGRIPGIVRITRIRREAGTVRIGTPTRVLTVRIQRRVVIHENEVRVAQ
jgi:hypothetical protein